MQKISMVFMIAALSARTLTQRSLLWVSHLTPSETESSPTLDAANLRQSLPNAICLCGWVRCCTAWEYWFVPASLGGQSRVVGVCWHKGSHCGAVCVSDTYVAQRARHRHSYPQNPTTMLICHLDAYFYPTSVSTAVIDKGAGGAFEKYQASAF